MVSAVRNQGKTAFVREVLSKNAQANPDAVNQAWREAGHDDSISSSLVQHVRSEMGLTGNITRRKSGGGDGTSAPQGRQGAGPKEKAGGRTPARSGGEGGAAGAARQPEAGARGDERTRVLQKLEGDIDTILFEIKEAGGQPEFEETLRLARRILARSYED